MERKRNSHTRRTLAVVSALLAAWAMSGCGSGSASDFVWGRTPSITPDGTKLVFCQNLSTPSDQLTTTVSVLDTGAIWTSAADGTSPLRLTPDGRGPDYYPTVSPDGQRIAFISSEDKQFDLWVERLDGSDRHKLTFDTAVDTMPCWSPDSRRIAFVSDRGGNTDIWMINLDGTGLQQVTSLPSDESGPAFSPDGNKIVFGTNRDRGNFDLWILDLVGGGLTQLTHKPEVKAKVSDGGPCWSPDGASVVFSRWDGHWEVYTIAADGTALTQLTSTVEHSGDPRYSSDGSTIYFTSSRTGWWQVWAMDANGANPRQVTGRN
ncbi:MAG: PD40 domain-containing protein [Armatimonadetes bacterium]|nr:PD40 domain-containing protein [Armatimonadota bacterium]